MKLDIYNAYMHTYVVKITRTAYNFSQDWWNPPIGCNVLHCDQPEGGERRRGGGEGGGEEVRREQCKTGIIASVKLSLLFQSES